MKAFAIIGAFLVIMLTSIAATFLIASHSVEKLARTNAALSRSLEASISDLSNATDSIESLELSLRRVLDAESLAIAQPATEVTTSSQPPRLPGQSEKDRLDQLYLILNERQRGLYFDPTLTPEEILARMAQASDSINQNNVIATLSNRYEKLTEYLSDNGYDSDLIAVISARIGEISLDAEESYLESFAEDPSAFLEKDFISASELSAGLNGLINADGLSAISESLNNFESDALGRVISQYKVSESAAGDLRAAYISVMKSGGGTPIGVGPITDWLEATHRLEVLQEAGNQVLNTMSADDQLSFQSALNAMEVRTQRLGELADRIRIAYGQGHYNVRR